MRYWPVFTNNALKRMKAWGLSESAVLDVWSNGERTTMSGGTLALVRKYSGYEIGLVYTRDKISGEYIITSVWWRGRR